MSKEFFNIQARNSFNKIGKYTSTHKGLSIQSATRAQVIYVREHILFCMTTDGSMSTYQYSLSKTEIRLQASMMIVCNTIWDSNTPVF